MPTPLAHTDYEKLDLEIGWRLPLAKHLEDSLLGILTFYSANLAGVRTRLRISCSSPLLQMVRPITALYSTPSAIGVGQQALHEKLLPSFSPGESGMLSDSISVVGQESG